MHFLLLALTLAAGPQDFPDADPNDVIEDAAPPDADQPANDTIVSPDDYDTITVTPAVVQPPPAAVAPVAPAAPALDSTINGGTARSTSSPAGG